MSRKSNPPLDVGNFAYLQPTGQKVEITGRRFDGYRRKWMFELNDRMGWFYEDRLQRAEKPGEEWSPTDLRTP